MLQAKNLAKNATILTKSIDQLNTLNKMKEQYENWEDDLVVVKEYIKQGYQAKNIANMLGKIKSTYLNTEKYIKDSNYLTSGHAAKISYAFTILLGRCVDTASESLDVITTGTYEMSDAERIKLLKESESKLKEDLS